MLWPGQAGCGRRRSAVSTRFEHCCSLAGRVSSGIAPARQVLYPTYACAELISRIVADLRARLIQRRGLIPSFWLILPGLTLA